MTDDLKVYDAEGNVITSIPDPGLKLPEGARLVLNMEPVVKLADVADEAVAIWATHRFVGFHAWPDAPLHRAYLASQHRHLFHARVQIEVLHDDREIEFHDLHQVMAAHCGKYERAGAMSCEMMARELRGEVLRRWPGRIVTAEISEDGEFGAMVLPSA